MTILLIFQTREEVRETLDNELRAFAADLELSAAENIAWNHREFQVRYICLSEEIKIGDYFLRVLLEESQDKLCFQRPYDFFNDLYHRFLTSQRSDMRCICLQAMTIVYRKCHEIIGAFSDTQFIFQNLEKTNERTERDRLVQFVEVLMNNEKNAKLLLDCNGIKILIELLTLSHLHTTRATVPLQSNLIEASPEMNAASSEKEWYYTLTDNKKQGPVSFDDVKELHSKGTFDSKTKFWAQGMEGWKTMRNVSQLKWAVLATDQPVMNESELCVTVLNILNKICSLYSSRDVSGNDNDDDMTIPHMQMSVKKELLIQSFLIQWIPDIRNPLKSMRILVPNANLIFFKPAYISYPGSTAPFNSKNFTLNKMSAELLS